MNYEELALFRITTYKAYPFNTSDPSSEGDKVQYGRRVTGISFSDADAARITFEDSGETEVIYGSGS